MTDQEKREKIIEGLEFTLVESGWNANTAYDEELMIKAVTDAIDLLKKSFTPNEVFSTVIEHGRHDKRFRLGDIINYSIPEMIDILRIEANSRIDREAEPRDHVCGPDYCEL